MIINFDDIHVRHIDLIDKRWGSVPVELVVEEAQNFLKEIRLAGRDISDPNERQRLQSYALYWGSFVFEETDEYPNTNLELAADMIVSASESLPESAKVAFYGLGAFAPEPETFTPEAIKTVTGASDIDLQHLVGNKFVSLIGEDLFVPTAVHEIALPQLDENVVVRHRDFYWELVSSNHGNWLLFDSSYGQIKKAWDALPDTAVLLDWIGAVHPYQRERSLWSDSITWLERGLKLTTTDKLQEEKAQLLDHLALAKVNLDQEREAVQDYQDALAIWQEVGNPVEEAATLEKIGRIYAALDEHRKTLSYYQQAEPVLENLGDPKRLTDLFVNTGSAYKALEEWEQALNYFIRAFRIVQKMPDDDQLDDDRLMKIYANIGAISERLNNWPEALQAFTELDKLQIKTSAPVVRAVTLNSLANINLNLGQAEEALRQYLTALDIQKKAGDPRSQVNTLLNLGAYYRKLKEMSQAINYYREALAIQNRIGDLAGQARTLNTVGRIYHIIGSLSESENSYQQARKIREEIGDSMGLANVLRNLGRLYGDFGKQHSNAGRRKESFSYLNQALNHFQQALKIYGENKDFNRSIITINDMGVLFYEFGQYKEALEHYQLVLSETEKKDPSNLMRPIALFNIAMIYRDLGREQDTIKTLQQTVEEARATKHPRLREFEIELKEELSIQS